MKYINYTIVWLMVMLTTNACKRNEVEAPDFDVAVSKTSFAVKETVSFNFSGNPDNISFFSGEKGKRFEYRGRTKAVGMPVLKFTYSRASGTQTGSLALMYSTNFMGPGVDEAETAANILKAQWDETTWRAVQVGTSIPSGDIDLTEIAKEDKPVYIAFKYTALAGSIQPKWTISELTLTNTLADGSIYTLANLTATAITNYGVATSFSPGWVAAKVKNNYTWVISSGKSLVITGATTAANATAASEAWTFIGPVDLRRVSPDMGEFVKDMTTRASNFTFEYTAAGNYSAAFVASRDNIYGKAETVKKINLTVQ